MAVKATLPTSFGEDRDLYIRLNSIEDAQNHGLPTVARFRGFLSKEAFEGGAAFVWEREISFDADLDRPFWEQAYEALKNISALAQPDPPADPGAYVEDPVQRAKYEAALAIQVDPDPPVNATAQELRKHDADVAKAQAKRQTIQDVYAKDEANRVAAHQSKVREHAIATNEHGKKVQEIDRLNAQAAALRLAKDV
jgi:hypothetical protein